MTESEIIEVAREVFGLHNPSIITFANAIAQRTREECADLLMNTDLSNLPEDWKMPVAAMLKGYSIAIRSMTK